MTKKRISALLIAVAMILNIANYDFANEIGSGKFWLLIGEVGVLLISIFLLLQKDKKIEK